MTIMKSWLTLLAAVVAVVVIGCSKGETVTAVEVTPEQSVREILEQVAESGQGGSAVGPLMEYIEEMKATNPTLAAELEPGANALMGMMDAKSAKAKATEMLGKLGGGGGESAEGEAE